MNGDGNGWAAGPNGARLWGRFGAAGLLLVAPHTGEILLQHRAPWTACGGTWALPGGARDSHESPADAAVREAVEETSLAPGLLRIHKVVTTAGPFDADPARPELAGGWTYSTVIATTTTQQPLAVDPNEESLELRWVHHDEVAGYPLLPAFSEAWETLADEVRLLCEKGRH
ncbi:NUDIX domain-containing protein [Corynebacterium uterequi]|uniref:ADP-ribose pyrophosphatase n=1 Tax=Corynebacterium uterequi TaxID=1072256 RepID=A0A0G3HEY5_9CORY|nr:NUDIX hydrolase [Corynebacterium uterequi]AKK11911.1 ADP-ribose pyrophosphatase [Corynebacterium uterequi]